VSTKFTDFFSPLSMKVFMACCDSWYLQARQSKPSNDVFSLRSSQVEEKWTIFKRILLNEFKRNISFCSSVFLFLTSFYQVVLSLLWIWQQWNLNPHVWLPQSQQKPSWENFESALHFTNRSVCHACLLSVYALCFVTHSFFFIFVKVLTVTFLVMDLVCFLHVRWFTSSKCCISVIGKLVEKLLFSSQCGNLTCHHRLFQGLPFLVDVNKRCMQSF
jgi:hypothetical protein